MNANDKLETKPSSSNNRTSNNSYFSSELQFWISVIISSLLLPRSEVSNSYLRRENVSLKLFICCYLIEVTHQRWKARKLGCAKCVFRIVLIRCRKLSEWNEIGAPWQKSENIFRMSNFEGSREDKKKNITTQAKSKISVKFYELFIDP